MRVRGVGYLGSAMAAEKGVAVKSEAGMLDASSRALVVLLGWGSGSSSGIHHHDTASAVRSHSITKSSHQHTPHCVSPARAYPKRCTATNKHVPHSRVHGLGVYVASGAVAAVCGLVGPVPSVVLRW